MSLTGHVIDGKIVLDNPTALPNGTTVHIEPVANGSATTTEGTAPAQASSSQTLAKRWQSFLKHTIEAPADASEQHDHYLYGTPKT